MSFRRDRDRGGPGGGGGRDGRDRRPVSIDRETTCPFLVRCFVRVGSHHEPGVDISIDRLPLAEEAQIYTWKDATLREVMLNLLDSTPSLKAGYARYSFKILYLDPSPPPTSLSQDAPARYISRELGTVFSKDLTVPMDSANPKGGGLKTLDECRFIVGDLLSIAVLSGPPTATAPAPGGIPASRSAPFSLGGRGGPQLASAPTGPSFSIRGRGAPGGFGGPGAGNPRRASDSMAWGPAGGARRPSGTGPDSERWGHVGDARPPAPITNGTAGSPPLGASGNEESGWGRPPAPSRDRDGDKDRSTGGWGERPGGGGGRERGGRGRSRSRSPPGRISRAADGW